MSSSDDQSAPPGGRALDEEGLGRFGQHRATRETVESQRTPRLDAYLAATRNGFDVLALCTIWLSFLPLTGEIGRFGGTWWLLRIALSLAFFVDLVLRSVRARHPWRYWRDKPLLVLEVILPPIRVFFSLRLLRTVFRRGNLARFMVAAGILAFNLAIIVWACEQTSPDRNIDNVWEAFWWAIVTVTTTGYGDYTPVTTQGRVFAVVLMGLGVTTLAVLTAQVASTFQEQAARNRARGAVGDPRIEEVTERLARIEELLAAGAAPDGTGPPQTGPPQTGPPQTGPGPSGPAR
jgi:voltage-gated potassium channel